MKTSELTGAALDWAVARAMFLSGTARSLIRSEVKQYSTDWAQGGPIIERENISLLMVGWDEVDAALPIWEATSYSGREVIDGDTPLVAAMRCYCASKLGADVEIPEELK